MGHKPFAMLCLVAQLGPTLCDPVDCSLPGSSVHGIFQARIQEWVALPFPDPGIEPISPVSPALQADSLPAKPPGEPNFYGLTRIFLHVRRIVYHIRT